MRAESAASKTVKRIAAIHAPATLRDKITHPPTTTSPTGAIRGKYIRCSAAISVNIGNTLDDGAKMMKNQAPKKPSQGLRQRRTTDNTMDSAISVPPEPSEWAIGQS